MAQHYQHSSAGGLKGCAAFARSGPFGARPRGQSKASIPSFTRMHWTTIRTRRWLNTTNIRPLSRWHGGAAVAGNPPFGAGTRIQSKASIRSKGSLDSFLSTIVREPGRNNCIRTEKICGGRRLSARSYFLVFFLSFCSRVHVGLSRFVSSVL